MFTEKDKQFIELMTKSKEDAIEGACRAKLFAAHDTLSISFMEFINKAKDLGHDMKVTLTYGRDKQGTWICKKCGNTLRYHANALKKRCPRI